MATRKQKVRPRLALARILKKARRSKKVVFTNGCFDILHLGHVRLLEKARSQGDLLVVGLNSDSSLRRLKGPGRPLTNQRARAELLASLECVDFVTFFSEPTPAETIDILKPDVLIKGGDYKRTEIVGHDKVKKLVRFPVVKGYSTTALIHKILKTYGRETAL